MRMHLVTVMQDIHLTLLREEVQAKITSMLLILTLNAIIYMILND